MKTLKNGAKQIERKGDVVLAKWKGGEYVTWKIDSDGNCYWGHYFGDDISAAIENFQSRSYSLTL